jgi:hypothetical protein
VEPRKEEKEDAVIIYEKRILEMTYAHVLKTKEIGDLSLCSC